MDILEGLYDLGMTSVTTVFQMAMEKAIRNTISDAICATMLYVFFGFIAIFITMVIIAVIHNNRLECINGKLTDEINELKKMNQVLMTCGEDLHAMRRINENQMAADSPYRGEPEPTDDRK